MKKALLSVFMLTILYSSSTACGGLNVPAYSGEIRYSFGGNGQNPLHCSIEVTLYFDVFDGLPNDSIFVNWGDGKQTIVFGSSITLDTTRPIGLVMPPIYQHVYHGEHTYDSVVPGGYCHISVAGQYRLNYTSNIGRGLVAGMVFYIEAKAAMDSTAGFTNRSPQIAPPGIKFGMATTDFYLDPLAGTDPDGDSLVFEAVAPRQQQNIEVPDYLYPNQFCNKYEPGTSNYTVDPHTGEIHWTGTCYQGIYTITTAMHKYRNGRLMGTIVRDQNIYMSAKQVTTGLSDGVQRNNPIKIFNAPVDNQLQGYLDSPSAAPRFATIFSADGRVVIGRQAIIGNTFNIDVSGLPMGIYLLQIKDVNYAQTQTFAKF